MRLSSRYILACLMVAIMLPMVTGCRIQYSFSGTSIQPDVKSFTVEYFENKAPRINPSLANNLSEALIDKYRKLTPLDMMIEGGDLVVSGTIIGYDTKPVAVTADEVAAQTRLTITLKLKFTNRLHPEEDFEKNLSSFADFDSTQPLDAVESQLCDDIIEMLVEDIFNATVANW